MADDSVRAPAAHPDDPLKLLRAAIKELHLHRGEPPTRAISARANKVFSHTTVAQVLRCDKLPRWAQLEAVVGALDGNVDEFLELWKAARRAQQGAAPPGPTGREPVIASNGPRSEALAVPPAADLRTTPFTLGPMKSTLLIVEGDGEVPIAREDVRLVVSKKTVEVPDEVAEWRDAIAKSQERIRESGREPMWNGSAYAVEYISVSRVADVENPRVSIGLQWSDYFTFLAAQQLDRPMRDGGTLRSAHLDGKHWASVPPFIASSFGINVAVTTADDQIIFSKRSNRVGTRPNVWNSSANEGLSRGLDSAGVHPPDLYAVAERGLSEELAIFPGECDLQLLGITLDVHLHHWGCIFWGRLKELTADRWLERTSRGVQDRFEHDGHVLVPFTPEAVIQKLVEIDRYDAWAPVVPALYFMTLVRRFGRSQVERAAAALL